MLGWFWTDPQKTRSFTALENVCINLYAQFFSNALSKDAKYVILYPLIRYGVLEFYGNNQYGLAPASALIAGKWVMVCNGPAVLAGNQEYKCVYDSELGLALYEKTPALLKILQQHHFACPTFYLSDLLNKINLNSVVHSWEDNKVVNPINYYFFGSHFSWQPTNNFQRKGIYKKNKENYAQRVLLVDENTWKTIPMRKDHPDGFSIAAFWGFLQSGVDLGVSYYKNQEKLVIAHPLFPLLIERLLFINTLFKSEFHPSLFKRHYYISQKDFLILNKIFNNRITVL